MKEHGLVESWIKMFVLNIKFYCCNLGLLKGLKLLESGGILLYAYDDGLMVIVIQFCIIQKKNHTMLDLNTHGIKSTICSMVHNPKFASLKNLVGGNLLVLNARLRC